MKLELKHFQKIKSDKEKTVMQHPKGHTIHVEHSALSEDERKSLHSLPFAKMEHKKKPELQKMAEGGSVADKFKQAEAGKVSPSPAIDQPTWDPSQGFDPALVPAEHLPEAPAPAPENPLAQAANIPFNLGIEALGKQGQAIQGNVAPQQEELKAQEKSAEAAILKRDKLTKVLNQAYEDYDKHSKAILADMETHKDISPDRYINNMSTGRKISTALGMLVSGLGGNSGENNSVIKFLNQQVQNDIHAQEKDFEHKDNLLKRYTEAFGNKREAVNFLHAQALGAMQLEIQRAAAKSGNLQVQNNADAQIAALEGEKSKYIGEAAMSRAMYSALGQSGEGGQGSEAQHNQLLSTLRLTKPELAKQIESRTLPGVGISSVTLDAGDKKAIEGIKNFQNILQEAKDLDHKIGKLGAWTPTERAEATRIKNDLISSYNDVKGLARFTGNEEKLYEGIIGNLGSINVTGSQRTVLENLGKTVEKKKDLIYKMKGITPFTGAEQSPSSQSNEPVKGEDGKMYIRQGNYMVPVGSK